ncbi:MAG: peptide chain release factor 1 [Chloroflexi bacterium]|nr:peptide chain release factor 1 [Chloroflexota bacterium]
MWDKLDSLQKRYDELTELLAQPEVATDPARLSALAKERAALEPTVAKYQEYKAVTRSLEETLAMLQDGPEPEMLAMVKDELEQLKKRQEQLQQDIRLALLSKDPSDERDVIVEIRGGTGGEEAALFAADLFRMYSRYAQNKRWSVEVIDSSPSERGGFKEVVFEVKGKGVFGKLKYERGVHRVQRVPDTEASGRVHTSTATVAILPEADEVDLDINPGDLKIEFYHSRGAGGQNVNKVATAVRVHHIPTGITAQCQDERSQLRNKQKAMAVLRARVLEHDQQKKEEEMSRERRSQVGTGERAEKIRTYNFPQDRVSDHRIDKNFHNLPAIMEGEIGDMIEALVAAEQSKRMEAVAA